MGNMARKGLLAADKQAGGYRYSATGTLERVGREVLDETVARLWRGDAGAAIAHLLGLSRRLDRQELAELRGLAEELSEESRAP